MTSITDRLTKPKGFVFPIGCGFQISVPSTWGVTGPTFPTGNLVVLEVPLGMHHLDETTQSQSTQSPTVIQSNTHVE